MTRALRVAPWIAIALAALAIAWLRPGDVPGTLGGIEGRLLDLRFQLRGPREAPDNVAILAVDDAAIARFNRFPAPRDAIAAGIAAALADGAEVVAVDLLLTEPAQDPPEDAQLAAALEGGRVLLAAAAQDQPRPLTAEQRAAAARSGFAMASGESGRPAEGLLAPLPMLSSRAALAHVNVAQDEDGALRGVPAAILTPDGVRLPALPVASAQRLAGLARPRMRLEEGRALWLGSRRMPLGRDGLLFANYYGPRGAIRVWSLAQAADGGIPPGALSGRAVFVGATATGFRDAFATPYDEALPGVEALATLAANLHAGETLRRDGATWALDAALAVIFALLGFWAGRRSEAAGFAAASLGALVAAGAALHAGFAIGELWLDASTVIFALSLAWAIGLVSRIRSQRREAVQLTRERGNLARYQSPLIAETLARSDAPDFDAREQTAAVLFVDVANYTARSEALGPAGAHAFLRRFHAAVERAALASGGVIEQFAGDGATIIFGLPDPAPDDADRAVACARRLFEEVAALNADLAVEGADPAAIRIGAHFGPVVGAVLGGDRQRHVTVTGDTINTASRLVDEAKRAGTDFAVSRALLDAAYDPAAAKAGFMALGERVIRGRSAPLEIWAGRRAAPSS